MRAPRIIGRKTTRTYYTCNTMICWNEIASAWQIVIELLYSPIDQQ